MATGKRKAAAKNPLAASKGPSQFTVIAVIVVVAFAAVVGVGVYWKNSGGGVTVPANATAQGVTVGNEAAPKTIDVYLDFQCPICRQFEAQAGRTLDQIVSSGQAKIVYHPIAILDRASSTRYSTRAGSAAGCAAAAGVFPQYEKLLYDNQPAEGGAGLPDEKLVELGQQAGAGGDFAQCVEDQRYAPWVAQMTQTALRDGVSGTPTVKVDGQQVDAAPQAIQQAVAAG
ncbi:thioredoxin domain-containing protein [Pseudonocardia spirodelae]|uniref:Thioredoxin domain-containing protein n=1 Tax=Pseudonocardia spirodelae TaxID=3133431 RepID=A0ABU8T4M2_9PSEU